VDSGVLLSAKGMPPIFLREAEKELAQVSASTL
jgi:hypothetical protein